MNSMKMYVVPLCLLSSKELITFLCLILSNLFTSLVSDKLWRNGIKFIKGTKVLYNPWRNRYKIYMQLRCTLDNVYLHTSHRDQERETKKEEKSPHTQSTHTLSHLQNTSTICTLIDGWAMLLLFVILLRNDTGS